MEIYGLSILNSRAQIASFTRLSSMSGSKKSKKAASAANTFHREHAQVAYRPRGTILAGMSCRRAEDSVCDHCESLLDLRDIFNSFVHTGRNLKWCKTLYPKAGDAAYRKIKQQNE